MIKEFSWVVVVNIGDVQLYHLAVTCSITVASITIVIVDYLPCQITQTKFSVICIWTSGENNTDRKLWLMARFGYNFVCNVPYLPTVTPGKATVRISLPRLLMAANGIQNRTYRQMITYPQMELAQ